MKHSFEKNLVDDSRLIKKGDVFVAYPGLTRDGRDFIKEAFEKGASTVVYDNDNYVVASEISRLHECIPYPHLKESLGKFASEFYDDPSQSMTVIGVTGTNGKTSITHFIADALTRYQKKCAVMGTLGNGFLPHLKKTTHTTLEAISLQRTLFELKKEGAQAVAMEVSSHALDQQRVQAVRFHAGIFTNLSQDHLDYHENMEYYGLAKMRLFTDYLLTNGILNLEDSFSQKIIDHAPKTTDLWGYSLKPVNTSLPLVVARSIQPLHRGFVVGVETPWGAGEFTTSLLGEFNISNLLAVLTALCTLGVPLFDALYYLSELKPVTGRMELLGAENQPRVVIDYAHTPDALENVLNVLRKHCQGRLICVMGCGGNRDRGKRPKMGAIAERLADYIILTNDNPRSESPELIVQEIVSGISNTKKIKIIYDRAVAIAEAVQNAKPHDIVLIAGKGHEMTQIIDDQEYPFSDRTEVEKALQK